LVFHRGISTRSGVSCATAKAWEEAAKACEDLALLLVCVKELEEDVALVSSQHDALNV
jgi:hypothetical protein